MNCPKCGKKINKNYCMFCGYMIDKDVFIDKNKTGEPTILEKFFGDEYDKEIRRGHTFFNFIFGPFYLLLRGMPLVGLLLTLCDLFLFYIVFMLVSYFPLPDFGRLINLMYILFNRFLWVSLDKIIYKSLLEKKLLKIAEKHPDDYMNYFEKMSITKFNLLSTFILFIVILCLFFVFFDII